MRISDVTQLYLITNELKKSFPNIEADGFQITSPPTTKYNCIAWAATNDTKFWWPDSMLMYYWPDDIPREETLEAFILLYKKLGYEVCESQSLEEGFEKVAIYTKQGIPTHGARQLPTGKWTSKLGQSFDIEHTTPFGLHGPQYGEAVVFLKRVRH